MKKEEQEIFFVNLTSPVEIQRAILESTKSTLSNLKRYESFRKIREYKAEYLIQLKHIMGELKLLNNRLKKVLPITGLRAISENKEKAPKKEETSKKEEVKPPKTNLNKLEDELSIIESRLKSLEQ